MDKIVVLSVDELKTTVDSAVCEALHKVLPKAIRQATTKELLTKSELMNLTGWSGRQIEYKKAKRELPYIRRGRLILFRTDEIFRYLREGYVPSKNDR